MAEKETNKTTIDETTIDKTAIGETVEVELGPVAHGGACVARLPGGAGPGRVVFVRGGLPGERVRAVLTDTSRKAWWRAQVAEVLVASPGRVVPPCPLAGRCGGCDFQHIALPRQRELKAGLVAEQLRRLAGVTIDDLIVEAVPGDQAGLGWRTRMRYLVQGGRAGLRAAASHDLVALSAAGCPLAVPGGPSPQELAGLAGGAGEVCVTVADSGLTVWRPGAGVVQGQAVVTEQAAGRVFQVRADGFWQVHPGAANALAEAVRAALKPQPGERAVDLYCGVGLFAAVLAGAGAQVLGVEANRAAVNLARRNVPGATFQAGPVEKVAWDSPGAGGLVVLDPPRAGAGCAVVHRVAATRPREIAYVACDPAALARDIAYFAAEGYALANLQAFDIFPMTSHVESLALLNPQ